MTRRLRALLGLGIGLLTTLALPAQRKQIVRPQYPHLSQRVNTLIGTDWVGNVYPGASAPFGMVQLSPTTGERAGTISLATSTPTARSQASATRT